MYATITYYVMHNGSKDLMFVADDRNKHSIKPCNKPPIFNFADLLNDLGTSLHSKHRYPERKKCTYLFVQTNM